MALCSMQTGMLFWKKQCELPSVGNCSHCSRFVCAQHGTMREGGFLCSACYREETGDDSDSSSSLSWSSGGSASASASDGGWSGGDSGGSSDSGGGGGDSGGSSGD